MKKTEENFEKSLQIVQAVRSAMAETIVGQESLVDGILIACMF